MSFDSAHEMFEVDGRIRKGCADGWRPGRHTEMSWFVLKGALLRCEARLFRANP